MIWRIGVKSKEVNIFNLDAVIMTAESLYEEEESQTLFKKDKKVEKELKIYIKE